MRFPLIAALALALAVPTASDSRKASPAYDQTSVDRLVDTCRKAARASFEAGAPEIMGAYIDNLLAHRERDRDEILACASYLAGARDMAEGRILPLDFD